MPHLFANDALSTIDGAISDSATTIVLTTDANLFPAPTGDEYAHLTLFDFDGNKEIVKLTARSGTSCTVVRAQEGTTAIAWPDGTAIELRVTADSLSKCLTRDGNPFSNDTEREWFRDEAGISALFAETLVDDNQVEKITTAVSYVEFDVPASGGESFLLLGIGIRSTNDGNISFQTSFATDFDAGATNYDSKWLYSVGASAPVYNTIQSGAPVITSNFYGDAGAQYIPVTFNGLLFAGNANVWPSFLSTSGYYSTSDAAAVQQTQIYRRSSGRITKLRFGHTGGTFTRGTFILAKVRGS